MAFGRSGSWQQSGPGCPGLGVVVPPPTCSDPPGRDDEVIVSGPPISDHERDEILDDLDETLADLDPDEIANIGACDGCVEGKAQAGTSLGGGACITWNGDKLAVLTMVEVGSGLPFAGFGVGGILTNAGSEADDWWNEKMHSLLRFGRC
jgi:hypothetical protein